MKLHVLVIAIALVGCKKKVDIEGYEKRLTSDLEARGIEADKVTCPKDVKAKEGEVFVCKVTIAGKDYDFEATIDSIDGSELAMQTRWVDGQGILGAKVEDALGKQLTDALGDATVVDCDAPLRFVDKDGAIDCKATAGGTAFVARITFDKDSNATGWTLTPDPVPVPRLLELLTPSVQAKLGPTVTVTCGDKPFLIVPDDGVLTCEATDGAKTAKLAVQFKPGTTDVDGWKTIE